MADYYIIPAIEELEAGAVGERAAELRARIALAIGNREALMRVLGDDAEFDNFYPDMEAPQLSTNAAIDAFLDRFGTPQETDLITRMIFDGSAARGAAQPEIGEVRADDASAPDVTAQRIDAYLAANPVAESASVPAPVIPATPPEPVAEPMPEPVSKPVAVEVPTPAPPVSALSETLASMMIKNGNYTKALEIISQLSLDMPKKSIYFADQIRFLRKLIANKERLESVK